MKISNALLALTLVTTFVACSKSESKSGRKAGPTEVKTSDVTEQKETSADQTETASPATPAPSSEEIKKAVEETVAKMENSPENIALPTQTEEEIADLLKDANGCDVSNEATGSVQQAQNTSEGEDEDKGANECEAVTEEGPDAAETPKQDATQSPAQQAAL